MKRRTPQLLIPDAGLSPGERSVRAGRPSALERTHGSRPEMSPDSVAREVKQSGALPGKPSGH